MPPEITQNNVPVSSLSKPPINFKKIILGIVAVLIFVGVCVLGWYAFNKTQITEEPIAPALPQFDPKTVVVQAAPQGQIITGFPAGLVVDSKAVVLGSSEDVTGTSTVRTFSTVYSTKLSASVIKAKYSDFAKKNGYEIKGDLKQETSNIFGMAKDYTKSFMIMLSENSTKQEILVSVIFNQNQ